MGEDSAANLDECQHQRGAGGVLVSIIIPTFNRARLLAQALESIALTRYRPIEIVVADDGSSDDTAVVVAAFARAQRGLAVQFLPLAHEGAIRARNAGVAAARGQLIFFLDSDDLLDPHGLPAMVAALADEKIPYCVGQLVEQDLAGNAMFAEGHGNPVLDTASVVRSQWPTIVGLYRRAVFDRLGAFNGQLEYGADKEFLWRIVAGCPPGRVIPDVVAVRRNHPHGQLTDGYSPGVMGHHTIAALDAFAGWASPRGLLRRPVVAAARPRLWLAAVRAGSAGNAAALGQAGALSAKLEQAAPSQINRAVMRLIAILPRPGFALVNHLLAAARRALHGLRNLRRRLAWPR